MSLRTPPARSADAQFQGLCRVLVQLALTLEATHPELLARYRVQKADRERREP